MDLSVVTVEHGRWTIVIVIGELDMASAPTLRAELRRLANSEATAVAVDLDAVGFCDSVGLGVLVGARRRVIESGGEFAVIVSAPRLERLFAISGLDSIMMMVASRNDLSR
jgi:anti-sigma B factor antagonist